MRENWIFCSRRRLCSRILKRRHFSSTLLSSSIRNFYIFICFCFLFIYFDLLIYFDQHLFLSFFFIHLLVCFFCLIETKKTNRKISGIESYPCKHMQIQKDADYPQQIDLSTKQGLYPNLIVRVLLLLLLRHDVFL